MRNLVIYDMDKTITQRATYSAFLLHMARTRAPWRLALAPLSGLYALAYLARLISRERLKERNHALFLGRAAEAESLREPIKNYAAKVLASNCLAMARAQIAEDKAKGCTVMMATASYELYAGEIGAALGCDTVLGTRLKQDPQGRVLAQIDGANCYGMAKLARINAWLEANGGRESWRIMRCYSDHVSDAQMLQLAQDPVAANPHPPLSALAKRNGWRIVNWL